MAHPFRTAILAALALALTTCGRRATPVPSGSGSAAPPVDGSHKMRDVLAPTARVRVRQLTPVSPAIRPAVREVVIADPAEVVEIVAAIGAEQYPDASQCLTCVPALTLAFEDAAGQREATVGLPCGADSDRPTPATFSTPASSRCATVSVADLAAVRAIVARHAP